MNSNGNYYDNSYYAENCSLLLPPPPAASEFVPLEYSEGTNPFSTSTASSYHQPFIQYAYETAGVLTEMSYGYQFPTAATSPIQMHHQQQYWPQNQQIAWMPQQFPPAADFELNANNQQNFEVNSIEMNKLAERVASVKFGQKKALKRKSVPVPVPMRKVKGGRYAIIAAGTNKKWERTEDQKNAQKETKANNKKIIQNEKFQIKVDEIMAALTGTELDKIKANFMICSKYKEGRRKDPHKYFRDLIERILVKTMAEDREKLVELFAYENFVREQHIWAVPKKNKKAKLPRNKQFTMQINVFKKPYQIAEILIIMKRGILMEPGEMARFTIIGNCKINKVGRQCINPWHYELKYSAMDLFLFNNRLEWQQSQIKGTSAGEMIEENEWKWDAQKEENANKLNSFAAPENEIEEYNQSCSSNCSSP